MVFIYSRQFLRGSLESLTSSLVKSGYEKFSHLHKINGDLYPDSLVEDVERKVLFSMIIWIVFKNLTKLIYQLLNIIIVRYSMLNVRQQIIYMHTK
jgi:hypothetical protein